MFESDFFGVAGFFLSLIAIPITFVVARRTRLRPEIRYVEDHDVLVEPKAELIDRGLSITFANHTLRQVSRTYIAFWNHRGDTIKGSDTLSEDPLRVQLEDLDTVVDVSIVWYSRKQNRLTVIRSSDDQSVAYINFDFLDAGDGAVIQVVHERGKPTLTGTIRGCTIKNKGSSDLTESTLSHTKTKSFRKRIARREGGPSLFPPLLIPPMAAFGFFLDPIINFFRSPQKVVDSSKYDLTTRKGQEEFAREVGPTGSSDSDSIFEWGFAVMGTLFTILMLVTVYSRARRLVPVSILRHRAEDPGQVAAELPQQVAPRDVS
ncbi:hypothetical protein [Micromonospora sp. NPDC049497]|uniref:hypothetical protein n=1 Tax=Micromonospora sp. NPDC049497 TaxID=3364273 RepID=UPI0037A5C213